MPSAEEIELEMELDRAYQRELAQADQLSRAVLAKAEWDAFVKAFVAEAKAAGKEAALNSLPFLSAALRLALKAALAAAA